MRSIRAKKIKNEASKYLVGPYDDSLIQIQLDKNEKCMQEISKDNYTRAAEFLRQIKTDGEMISSLNPEKQVIRCLALNTEAYLHEKQRRYEQALQCLDEAERIQMVHGLGPVEKARTKLNKTVILSHLGKHDQSVGLAQSALELLKNKKNIEEFQLHKNQYKLYEIMIVSFYNIASELTHLSDAEGAHKVYKEGYYLAQKMLGPQHKLTMLLRGIIKSHNKAHSKSREKIEISDIGSNKSLQKIKSVFKDEALQVKTRQRQLMRIYAPKRNSYSQVQQEKYLKNDTTYYLRSLQKLKESKRRRQHTQSDQFVLTFDERNTGKIRKMHTQSSNHNRYEEKTQHQKIKDIILNGKVMNKSHVYSTLNRTQPVEKEKSLPKIKVEPQVPSQLPKIVAQKPKETKEESFCQLI